MGSFGYGPLENDAALDTVEQFDGLIRKGVSPERAVDAMLGQWRDGNDLEVLALIALCWERQLRLPELLTERALEAIGAELENVGEWSAPQERKRVLLAMAERLGEKPRAKRGRGRRRREKHPAMAYANLDEAERGLFKLIDIYKKGGLAVGFEAHAKLSADDRTWLAENFPPFMTELTRLHARTEQLPDGVDVHVLFERRMITACFTGLLLLLEPEETQRLVRMAWREYRKE